MFAASFERQAKIWKTPDITAHTHRLICKIPDCPEKSISGLYQSSIFMIRNASPSIMSQFDSKFEINRFIFTIIPP